MRNPTLSERLSNFFQILAASFDVTGLLQERIAASRKRRFQVLLQKQLREARSVALRLRLEEHERFDQLRAESEARRRAARNLKSHRERLAAHRQQENGFVRDMKALSSDWRMIDGDMEAVFNEFEVRYPEGSSSSVLTHAAQ